jgi:hypothetical protein
MAGTREHDIGPGASAKEGSVMATPSNDNGSGEHAANDNATGSTRSRRTLTDNQVVDLQALDNDRLLVRSLDALHALNRRAIEKRDRRNRYKNLDFADAIEAEIEAIHDYKTRFLDALVGAGLAHVETFTVERRSSRVSCIQCHREWVGDTLCFKCGDDTGERNVETETWYVVTCGLYRFHQPEEEATKCMVASARTVPPHDPSQPQREIPQVGLTVKAQFICIDLMMKRLRERKAA